MARYKEYDYSQGKFIPISFDKQILPGTFEHTLHYLIDNEIDLSAFDFRYKNDKTGAPACDPRVLLKVVLYAYFKGITSSRKIADCCNENVVFMALSAGRGDPHPHVGPQAPPARVSCFACRLTPKSAPLAPRGRTLLESDSTVPVALVVAVVPVVHVDHVIRVISVSSEYPP